MLWENNIQDRCWCCSKITCALNSHKLHEDFHLWLLCVWYKFHSSASFCWNSQLLRLYTRVCRTTEKFSDPLLQWKTSSKKGGIDTSPSLLLYKSRISVSLRCEQYTTDPSVHPHKTVWIQNEVKDALKSCRFICKHASLCPSEE